MGYSPIPQNSNIPTLVSSPTSTLPKTENAFFPKPAFPLLNKTDVIGNNLFNIFQYDHKDNSLLNQSTSTQSKSFSNSSFMERSMTLREKYYSHLVIKNILRPLQKPTPFNSIIILDWDDTLLPTSFLLSTNFAKSKTLTNIMWKIESNVFTLLDMCLSKGDVYIITNAEGGWVESSAKEYYPHLEEVLRKVHIISAREKYQLFFPDDPEFWKIQAFVDITREMEREKVANVVCIGDSHIEMEASCKLRNHLSEVYVKTIKFKECPQPGELNKQISLVINKFDDIYNAVKNLAITVGKKKNVL